ncbi:MAG TPA: cysteine methyltransferase [Firmicutes bacterium]|nr:cysteine methyltransferase [Bacillota bacterium]
MLVVSNYKSFVGDIVIAVKEDKIVGLWIGKQRDSLSLIKEEMISNDNDVTIVKTKKWLDRYFNNEKPDINELPLNLLGTEFQLLVWNILKEIPYGEVISYKEIADRIAKIKKIKKMSAQAVGGAVHRNPISIIIPCHRVIGYNGNLTGYAGGIDIKVSLLKHEGIDMKILYLPKNK